ncbi:hypothetical protein CK219_23715 [Mesorhizobium sp. WSM4313]|nr:hypothetical protein CK219_23715 [Mesorhizobium sp. WSM4313]
MSLSKRCNIYLAVRKGGEEIDVEVRGPIALDNQPLMIEAALQGCGLAHVWTILRFLTWLFVGPGPGTAIAIAKRQSRQNGSNKVLAYYKPACA